MAGFANDPGTGQQEAGFGYDQLFWTESLTPGITAGAAGGQAGAVRLNTMFNVVSTVAAGASVALPPARPSLVGVCVCVINIGANPLAVFGQVNDTINSAAAAVGVTMLVNSIAFFTLQSVSGGVGLWLATGLGYGFATGNSASFTTFSTQTGVTATPAGTQANSVKVVASQVQISTAAAGSGVTMPPAIAGMEITIVNNGANSVNLFPASAAQGGVSGGDNFLGSGQNASVAQTTGTVTIYYCFSVGTWTSK